MAFVNSTKHSSTFATVFRHGKEPTLQDLANKTFTDTFFDNSTQIKDITFNQFGNQVWVNSTKHSSTFNNTTKH